jgi:hypothetical protein
MSDLDPGTAAPDDGARRTPPGSADVAADRQDETSTTAHALLNEPNHLSLAEPPDGMPSGEATVVEDQPHGLAVPTDRPDTQPDTDTGPATIKMSTGLGKPWAKRAPRNKDTAKRAAAREDMAAAKAETKRLQAEKVEATVRAIQLTQERIRENDRAIIPHMVVLGVHLSKLKDLAGRGWARRARELGYHPREASRYLLLGRMWGDQIGTIGSDLLAKLPADIKMLERICQIPLGQLAEFLAAKDVSEKEGGEKWDRTRLANEVKARTGEPEKPPRPSSPDRVVRSFRRAVSKAASSLRRSETGVASVDELRAQLHGALDEAVDELEATLGRETAGSGRTSP